MSLIGVNLIQVQIQSSKISGEEIPSQKQINKLRLI